MLAACFARLGGTTNKIAGSRNGAETSDHAAESDAGTFPSGAYALKRRLRLASTAEGVSGFFPETFPPSGAAYVRRGLMMAASGVEGVSDFIPVPGLGEFMRVIIAVLEACEEVTAIEETVKDLQDRVEDLAVLIIAEVPANKVISDDLRDKVKEFQAVLASILVDLTKIKDQNKILLLCFRDLNKDMVDKCAKRLDVALQRFDMAHKFRVEDVLKRIEINHSTIISWLTGVQNTVQQATSPHTAPSTVARYDIPPPPPVFFGRQHLVDSIVSLLASERPSRVCISGTGGMGKTALARAVLHSPIIKDRFLEYRFWVSCIEADSPDLLRRSLYTQLRVTAESYDSLDPLIDELNSSDAPRLIILDYFGTPPTGRDRDELRNILTRLVDLKHVALLVTITSAMPPFTDVCRWQHYDLPPLDEVAARETFYHLYPSAPDVKLDDLLDAIGYIPLAITLMAANGQDLGASPEDLLREWKQAGTSMILEMDQTISLSMNRDIIRSTPDALTLLAILSVLPGVTSGRSLNVWAGTLTSCFAAIQTLRAAALIGREQGEFATSRIFVHPTVQSYVSRHEQKLMAAVRDQVHNACYAFVLAHNSIPDDATYKADVAALAQEETNIHGLLMQIDSETLCPGGLAALLAFCLYQLRTKPSTVLARRALGLAKEVGTPRQVAEAHQRLGEILCSLGHCKEACPDLEKARERFRLLPDLHSAGECSVALLQTWVFMAEPFGQKDVSKTMKELSDGDDAFHSAHAWLAYGRFGGGSHCHSPDHVCVSPDERYKAVSDAKAVFEALQRPASICECLIHMARFCSQKEEYERASQLAREALLKAEEVGDPTSFGRISSITAGILIAAGAFDEAFVIIQKSLPPARAQGRPISIAQMLEKVGYISAAKMEVLAAKTAYKAAQEQYAIRSSTLLGQVGRLICSHNLEELENADEWDAQAFSRLQKSRFY
ncbi:hypothetical protein C8R44DRAFT_788029 [Mycena epipterygia]|nr:hypothetical protein C8R44DRAFT_788029 [Mycena epipterygia]